MPKTSDETIGQSLGFATAASLVGKGISFVRGLVFARLLVSVELGLWSLIIHSMQLAAVALGLGVPAVMQRFAGSSQQETRLSSLLTRGLAIVALVTLGALVLGWFYRDPLGWLLFDRQASSTVILLVLIGTAGTVTWNVCRASIQGIRAFRADAVVSLAYSAGFFLLAVILLGVFGLTAQWCATAYAICTWCAALIALLQLANWSRSQQQNEPALPDAPNKTLNLGVGRYALGYWLAGLLTITWKYLDRFMVLHLGASSETDRLAQLGDYFIVHKLAEPTLLLAATVAGVLTAHVSHRWDHGDHDDVRQMFRFTLKLGCLTATAAGCATIALTPWILELLIGRIGQWALEIVVPVTMSVILLSLFFIVRPFLLCRQRTTRLVVVWGLAALINGTLNWWWVPDYEVVGAAAATAVSAGFALAITLVLARIDDFYLEPKLCWILAAPGVLLLSLLWQSLVLVTLGCLAWKTRWLFDEHEKNLLAAWFRRLTSSPRQLEQAARQ